MYQHGGGHGVEDCETEDRVLSLLVNSFPFGCRVHEQIDELKTSLLYHQSLFTIL